MLFKSGDLKAIGEGRITLAFRRWKRPTVKAGGGLNTAVGRLAIDAVEAVDLNSVTEDEARRAGCDSLEALRAALAGEGTVYRIAFRIAGPDPRIALRGDASADALAQIERRLARLDASGAWTRAALQAIADNPGRRAGDLAPAFGWDTPRFKSRVRQLKALGLTESLEVGYRLSLRGEALIARRPQAG